MKAMILAAGKGVRMQPLTTTTPKPLLAVAGKPLIEHHIQALAVAGIKDIVINTWYLGEQIIDLIGDGTRFGVSISYSVEDQLMDTGGGIVKALPILGTDPFIVMSADIFTNFPLHTLPTAPVGLAHLVLVENPSYHIVGDFSLDKGKVKILDPTKSLTYGNIGVFRPEFFVAAPNGPFPLGNLLRHHVAADLVTGQYYSGTWRNIGTPAELELVNNEP
jgi:MurNAc alpha-1-phosphate uridylyltransferase